MPKSSILDDILPDYTALEQGQRLGEVAAEVGFDWPDAAQALEKVHEEVAELEELLAGEAADEVELMGELGDILFAVVNVARKLGIDAEEAMQRTNGKFRRRFAYIEAEVDRQGRRLEDLELDEMEALWQQAKAE
ncbi:hypothetical protein FIV42_29025 [Persicimonas caeni]|uniref:NTP pyrophosphohydrolase MazG-like domain-containing protein n=1 Tax=Persicimonas caeni TaxID=2292766 RepID=A0A4Y6Q280_PERCE|nr:MazG nucleotide pyrophosphohydrolase domain-containing protein [Persicimonas caeni]QDG54642.1 hypothetical protein FIV42_29025 [Persicimonas caeni]QED35863.1 hypothetical protein FRD00_29020 [Persicimonas caeni]